MFQQSKSATNTVCFERKLHCIGTHDRSLLPHITCIAHGLDQTIYVCSSIDSFVDVALLHHVSDTALFFFRICMHIANLLLSCSWRPAHWLNRCTEDCLGQSVRLLWEESLNRLLVCRFINQAWDGIYEQPQLRKHTTVAHGALLAQYWHHASRCSQFARAMLQ